MPNKEQKVSDQESKKDPITKAIENNPCGLCRAAGYPSCKGHGGGGGGGGGSSGGGSKSSGGDSGGSKNKNLAYTSSQATIVAIQEFDKAKTIWVQSELSSDKTINYETGLLSIESDRLHGNLVFQIKPGLSKDEMETARQFLKAVKTEFDEFKNQLEDQGVPTSDFTATLKDNKLAIHIPNPKYYSAFIKHLENKNLLPVPNPERQEKKESSRTMKDNKQKDYLPNPLSTRLEKK